ncbi:hypothetical protein HYQ45_015565 [Verticillium longisporum]|uniref:Uncharacterized protein n=1 Tax=Verticillium longisporum TaxID=100787 RepID=A0A8I3AHA4_VERLO|nr:hypothetical protein HYQ45_015565 [Verticillium longisporum]
MPGTLTICSLDSCRDATTNSFFGYRPNIIATALFVAAWTVIGLAAAGLALRAGARAHIPFTLTLLLAALAHVPGWCARLAASRDPWARWPWAQSTVALSTAPVLLSASLSLATPALLRALGPACAPLHPRTPRSILLPLDALALLLQVAGVTVAFRRLGRATPNINADTRPGVACLLAAHAVQAAALVAGLAYMAVAALRAGRAAGRRSARLCALAFVVAAAVRGVVLAGGVRGRLARGEMLFLAADAAPAVLAALVLVVAHPALWLSGESGRHVVGAIGDSGGAVDEGKGTFAKLQGVDFEVDLGTAAQKEVEEPPRFYDPQSFGPGRYEMSRDGAWWPQPYDGGAYRDRDEGDVGVRRYGPGVVTWLGVDLRLSSEDQ